MSHSGKDLTRGSIPLNLLLFALPMFIGNILNVGYNIADTIWVGKLIGAEAMGAVGTSFPVIFILIAVSIGLSISATILISQYYGAGNRDMVEKVVSNSAILSAVISITLSIAGILLAGPILRLLNTPDNIFNMALDYLRISFLGFFFVYSGILIAAIFRGIGDSITPLLFLLVTSVLNIILDPLLIIGIYPFPKLGLNGAAVATIISQGISFLLSIIYLYSRKSIVAVKPSKIRLETHILKLIFKVGFPSMIQQVLISVGYFVITALVNQYGSNAVAGFNAASKLDNFALMPALSLSMAISAMTGQHIGAGKPERIGTIFRWGSLLGFSFSVPMALISFFIPELLMQLFTNNTAVITIGSEYLRIIAISYIIFTIMLVSNGIINGTGATIVTMLMTLLSLWLVRIPLAWVLSRWFIGLNGIFIAMVVSFALIMTISLVYYSSGRWKKHSVKPFAHRPDRYDS